MYRTTTIVFRSGFTTEKLDDLVNDILTREGFDVQFMATTEGVSETAERLGCETDEES